MARIYQYPTGEYDEVDLDDFIAVSELALGIAEVNESNVENVCDRAYILSKFAGPRFSYEETSPQILKLIGLKTDIRPTTDSEFLKELTTL